MGIRSVGVDASPFCRFMTQTKLDALRMRLERARKVLENYAEVFEYFTRKADKTRPRERRSRDNETLRVMEAGAEYARGLNKDCMTQRERETRDTYNFLLLAYLDSVGYAERSARKTPLEQFKAVLERYLFVAEKIQAVLEGFDTELAPAEAFEGDARALPLADRSVDGIIFSPPYSFAIDYVRNDSFHLNYLGVNAVELRDLMIGLRGNKLLERYEVYLKDMYRVLAECRRVLRPGRVCTVVVGTNNNQLSKVLGVAAEEVRGIHEILTEQAAQQGFRHVRTISRPITGISNTMRREFIVMLSRHD